MRKVVSVENIKTYEKNIVDSGISNKKLITTAAYTIYKNNEWDGKIAILCGKGNNGADGLKLAWFLLNDKKDVEIIVVEKGDSIEYNSFINEIENMNHKIIYLYEDIDFSRYDIIFDSIFGIGFHGKLDDKYTKLINKINESNSYIISCDIPSGINADSGLGEIFIHANKVISISEYKFGYFINMGKDSYQQIVNLNIGIDIKKVDAYLIEKEDIQRIIKKRSNFSNKGDYGYVGILGGSKKYPGAIKLASLGQNALYSGAGVSRIIVPTSLSNQIVPFVLESTIYPFPEMNGEMIFNKDEIEKAIKGLRVLSIGPGWGINDNNKKILEYLIKETNITLIIDADALNILSMLDLKIMNIHKGSIILTPHLKEFSRLINCPIEQIIENLIVHVKEFTSQYNVTLLLKGPTTIIADHNVVYLSSFGTGGMATAGSGDVLTGILTGILSYSKENVTFTTACGAAINGLAGEYASKEYGTISMVSSDTARCVSKVIKQLESQEEMK